KFLSSNMWAQGDSVLLLYAVAEGRSRNEALYRNETMISRLSGMNGIRKMTSIAGLIPSDSLRMKSMARWTHFWSLHQDLEKTFEKSAMEAGFSTEAFVPFRNLMKDPSEAEKMLSSAQNPVNALIGHYFIMSGDSGYKVVNFIQVDKKRGEEMKKAISTAIPSDCFVFSQSDVSDHLAKILSDSFNYIGFVCGLVVFVFLWLSFRSIELSLMSFLPLAVSWIWILGIMDILGMQFNIVNVILATFIFGQGDDYTIFITEGLMSEYTTGKKRLETYKNSVGLSAVIMFIGIGTLILSKHPAMRSLAEVAIIGMLTVVAMAYYLPPIVFRWLTEKNGRRREFPVTLSRLVYSGFSITFFICGMFFLLVPYTYLLYKPLQRFWNGEHFYHRLLQCISYFIIRHVPGVKFREVNDVKETFGKPAVIICNHQSHLDLMAIMQLSPKIIVLTNDWVWNNPYYGLVIHTADFYPVSNGYDQNFPHLQYLVQRGYSIVVFPEGTRTSTGEIGRFHKGAFTLAKALGLDLLPLCIHGLYDVLPKHDFMLRRGSVTLEVGRRVSFDVIERMSDRDVTHMMRLWYVEHYASMRQRLETPEYREPYEAYRNKYKVDVE
ncbi:MAG: 1-acyl-sn-glycerol-3-phosphate acyltransferase, partial [Paraprevotella sp.]|nr:1-acyl-sn-glycerol-3-phosphate acyltransferase [Paraprevotella sp.]